MTNQQPYAPEQLLPHDLEAEAAVLGSLILDSDAFADVAPRLQPEDFYQQKHQLCYAACRELFQRSEVIDQVTLARELHRRQQLEAVGGMAYLSHLVSVTPTSTHAEYYARAVAHTAALRRLIGAGHRIAALGYADESGDLPQILRQAENLLFQVQERQPQDGFISLRQIYDQFLEDRADLAEPEDPGQLPPLLTGYGDLDQLLGGLQPSDMLILGGRPGLGKSALAVNIATYAARQGQTVGIFSLEMSRDQLGLRILAADAAVDAHRLRLGLLSEAEEQRINDSIGELSDLPVYIDDTPFQTILEMRGKARRLAQAPAGLQLLIVDYLQLIQGPAGSARRGDNRVQEISEISRSLKGLARDLQTPVLTCSQLSRLVENRPGHRPQLSDLRDSGSIEQDADVVAFLYREDLYWTEEDWQAQFPDLEYPKDIAELIIAKHRHGPTGSIRLRFRSSLVRFDELGRAPQPSAAGPAGNGSPGSQYGAPNGYGGPLL